MSIYIMEERSWSERIGFLSKTTCQTSDKKKERDMEKSFKIYHYERGWYSV